MAIKTENAKQKVNETIREINEIHYINQSIIKNINESKKNRGNYLWLRRTVSKERFLKLRKCETNLTNEILLNREVKVNINPHLWSENQNIKTLNDFQKICEENELQIEIANKYIKSCNTECCLEHLPTIKDNLQNIQTALKDYYSDFDKGPQDLKEMFEYLDQANLLLKKVREGIKNYPLPLIFTTSSILKFYVSTHKYDLVKINEVFSYIKEENTVRLYETSKNGWLDMRQNVPKICYCDIIMIFLLENGVICGLFVDDTHLTGVLRNITEKSVSFFFSIVNGEINKFELKKNTICNFRLYPQDGFYIGDETKPDFSFSGNQLFSVLSTYENKDGKTLFGSEKATVVQYEIYKLV